MKMKQGIFSYSFLLVSQDLFSLYFVQHMSILYKVFIFPILLFFLSVMI